VQTRQPGHRAVVHAARHDVEGFARAELAERQDPPYPPHANLANLVVSGTNERKVAEAAGALAAWLREHAPAEPVALCYFGKGRPASYGIQARRIDATALDAVYGDFPGHWNRDYEERYQSLVPVVAEIRQKRGADERSTTGAHPERDQVLRGYAQLRTARLLAFLRHREPDARAAFSILIFRLSAEDLGAALEGPPAELEELSWIQQEEAR